MLLHCLSYTNGIKEFWETKVLSMFYLIKAKRMLRTMIWMNLRMKKVAVMMLTVEKRRRGMTMWHPLKAILKQSRIGYW